MVWDDDDEPLWVAISALEHWSYCPRQCGLIHLEHTFEENLDTRRGGFSHVRVDRGQPTTEHSVRILRNVAVWSERLKLHGRVDAIEFAADVPYPVEYKSGHQRTWTHEAIQLCAQALCLEEMLGVIVPVGAIAYRGSGTRRELSFGQELRQTVADTAQAIRVMLASGTLPQPIHDRRCRRCSLQDTCLPMIAVGREHVCGELGFLVDAGTKD
jgi:CRISPR-associated exonuclease Cas4